MFPSISAGEQTAFLIQNSTTIKQHQTFIKQNMLGHIIAVTEMQKTDAILVKTSIKETVNIQLPSFARLSMPIILG